MRPWGVARRWMRCAKICCCTDRTMCGWTWIPANLCPYCNDSSNVWENVRVKAGLSWGTSTAVVDDELLFGTAWLGSKIDVGELSRAMEFSSTIAIIADKLLFVDRRAILSFNKIQTFSTKTTFNQAEKPTQKPIYKKIFIQTLMDKHTRLEGFPSNEYLLFAHVPLLRRANLLSDAHADMPEITYHTNSLTALFVVNLFKLHLTALKIFSSQVLLFHQYYIYKLNFDNPHWVFILNSVNFTQF